MSVDFSKVIPSDSILKNHYNTNPMAREMKWKHTKSQFGIFFFVFFLASIQHRCMYGEHRTSGLVMHLRAAHWRQQLCIKFNWSHVEYRSINNLFNFIIPFTLDSLDLFVNSNIDFFFCSEYTRRWLRQPNTFTFRYKYGVKADSLLYPMYEIWRIAALHSERLKERDGMRERERDSLCCC